MPGIPVRRGRRGAGALRAHRDLARRRGTRRPLPLAFLHRLPGGRHAAARARLGGARLCRRGARPSRRLRSSGPAAGRLSRLAEIPWRDWLPVASRPAALRAVRATVGVAGLVLLTDPVIGNPPIAPFAAL